MAKTIRKGVKNYTTSISVSKTVTEIEDLLARYGAQKILKEYDSKGQISSLSFMIKHDSSYLPIKLPTRIDSVISILNEKIKKGSIPKKYKDDKDQASRVMWRVILDWIDSQMTMIELNQRTMKEIFFADILDFKSGKTVYENLNTKLNTYLIEDKS